MNLRKRGKGIFVCSNSHFEPVDVVMEATIGPDWRELVDIAIGHSEKPSFFKANNETPFHLVDYSKPNIDGGIVTELK